MDFSIQIINGHAARMLINGKEAKLDDFLHTPYWDKANNVVTCADQERQMTTIRHTCRVTNENYDLFVRECLANINNPKFKVRCKKN
jgi:hypothetical protein